MNTHSKIKQAIREAYALEVSAISLLYNGVSKIFKITVKNTSLILKIFPKDRRIAFSVLLERKLLTYLGQSGILCSTPMEPILSDSEIIFHYKEKEFFAILMQLDKGENVDFIKPNLSRIESYGASIARLHKVKVPDFLRFSSPLTNTTKLMESLGDNDYTPQCDLLPLINRLYDSLETISLPSKMLMHTCICHGDAWPGNALFNKDSCALIDFEQSQIFTPAFDISTFLWWTLSHDNRNHSFKTWMQFKQGYGTDIEEILDCDLSTLIKINELRSLIFLYKNSPLSEEALSYIKSKSMWFTKNLKPNLNVAEIWKLA